MADEIQIGDVVVWVHHGNRSAGGIGCVAEVKEDKSHAFVIAGALTATAYDWDHHDVLEMPIARLGKLDMARYAEEGLFCMPLHPDAGRAIPARNERCVSPGSRPQSADTQQ